MSSTWGVEFTEGAAKSLKKLDKTNAQRIARFLMERVATRDDPRGVGRSLRGALDEYWRYRVGDYRIVCQILDAKLLVLVVRVGHRREVYE